MHNNTIHSSHLKNKWKGKRLTNIKMDGLFGLIYNFFRIAGRCLSQKSQNHLKIEDEIFELMDFYQMRKEFILYELSVMSLTLLSDILLTYL